MTRGLLIPVTYLVIPDIFDKYRGLALSINQAAVGVCQIAMPLLITFLQDEFGDRGAVLIHGGLILNCIVVAILISQYEQFPKLSLESRGGGTSSQMNANLSSAEESKKSTWSKVQEDMKLHFRVSYNTMKLFRVLILIGGACIFAAGYVNFVSLVPFVMRYQGFVKEDIAWCVSAFGFASAGGRIVITPLVDRKWFRSQLVYVTSGLFAALASFGNDNDFIVQTFSN